MSLKCQLLKTKPLDLLSNPHLKLSISPRLKPNPNTTKLMSKLPFTSSMKKNLSKLNLIQQSSIMNKLLKRFTICMQLFSTKNLSLMMRFCTHMLQCMRNKQVSKWSKRRLRKISNHLKKPITKQLLITSLRSIIRRFINRQPIQKRHISKKNINKKLINKKPHQLWSHLLKRKNTPKSKKLNQIMMLNTTKLQSTRNLKPLITLKQLHR